jgi:hypothetical protein
MSFHGSYQPADVTFLLKPVAIATTGLSEKELAIQSGRKHYSEMLSQERLPDERYMSLFWQSLSRRENALANQIARLSVTLHRKLPDGEIVLVSLARAGTPVGVLLHRALRELHRRSTHYSVSIIRDRGIDAVALDYILARHCYQRVIFVDGWTGKGAISGELERSVAEYNRRRSARLSPGLTVLADLCGSAEICATWEDYLIPSAILNATISGLVSRTVLNDDYVGPGDFHACAYYEEQAHADLSRQFVDQVSSKVSAHLNRVLACRETYCITPPARRILLKLRSDSFVEAIMLRYNVHDRNRVKPGIGESTRALLRRMPELLLLKDANDQEVQHLLELARQSSVPVVIDPKQPYKAAAIIKTLGV